MQDSKGYIWIGTDAGVSRFDGRRFENFSIDDGLPDNQILLMKEDQKGRIWLVAFNGEMSYFLDGKIYNSQTDPALQMLKFKAIVTSIFEDSKGKIWFGTNKNMLFCLDGHVLLKFTSSDPDKQFIFSYVNEDRQGKIWIYSNQCVRVFERGHFKMTSYAPVQPISYKTLASQKNNSIIYIDPKGLNSRKNGINQAVTAISPALLLKDPGYFFYQDQELWLSANDGVYHFDAQKKMTRYLQDIPAVQVFKDTRNDVWFTTNNGIYMLPREENRLSVFNKNYGLSSDNIKSLTMDKDHKLWLGEDYGHIEILDTKTALLKHLDIPDKKTYGGIKKLLLDTAGQSMYFASDYGLGVVKNIDQDTKSFRYVKEVSHTGIAVKDFSISSDGKMAIALSSGVVVIPNRNKHLEFNLSTLKDNIDFFNDRAYCVYYDPLDELWFSNINGFSKIDKNATLVPYHQNELLTKRINDIKRLSDGTMVLATDGYGLVLLKDGKITYRFTQKQGLASNICKKTFIQNNHIWVISNNGINRICLDGSAPLIEAFEYTNPLLKNDVNDLYIDKNTAYFATSKGLVYFHNKAHHEFAEAPRALISSIALNDQKISIKDPDIQLRSSGGKITIYFSAIDFQNQDIWYRYRLKAEDDWTETRNRRIEFSSLSAGVYSFELCARTTNSSWGIPMSINFTVKGPFWQRTWFLIFLIALAAFTFYRIAVVVTKGQKNKEQQKLLLKNKILMLEQRALQAMMNPHFVFNVMNSIQHYINTKDTSSANKILTGFAKLIRKNLEICTKSFISLEEELEYLELYLSLEKKRFGDKLRYHLQIASEIDKDETQIPSMLLQPYLENAIWHGIMPLDEGGDINIQMSQDREKNLLIKIIDNGIGIDNSLQHKKTGHSSKGMDLTQERINLLNKIEANPIQIAIHQNGSSGTTVSIKIPVH